jgi:hypothetical protein
MCYNKGKDEVPAEVMLEIFLFCVNRKSPKMFLNLMLVCKSWEKNMNENHFWQQAYENEFKLSLNHALDAKKNYIFFPKTKFDPDQVIRDLNILNQRESNSTPALSPFAAIFKATMIMLNYKPSISKQTKVIKQKLGENIICLHNFDQACKQESTMPIKVTTSPHNDQQQKTKLDCMKNLPDDLQKEINDHIKKIPNDLSCLKDFFRKVIFAQNISHKPTSSTLNAKNSKL